MRTLLWLPLFLILHCIAPTSSVVNVIPLRYDNFEAITQVSNSSSKEDWIVFFYAPWCKHCKKTMPVFEKASSRLFKRKNFATVNIEKSPRRAMQSRKPPSQPRRWAGERGDQPGQHQTHALSRCPVRSTSPAR